MINENMAAKSEKSVKTAKSAKPVKIDLKGVVFCKAKKCMNSNSCETHTLHNVF